jgi:cellulose synthase/poly-beta-1,6-N-acetylglucosamine synthase-like glycosyltransferase
MLVTEGKVSRTGRWFCVTTAGVLVVGATCFFVMVPSAAGPVLWAGATVGSAIVLRDLVFSVIARFVRPVAFPGAEFHPSLTLVIPCLNELPSLRRTVPAMAALEYAGDLRFYYVCEDASSDGSVAYLAGWAAKDCRITVVEKTTPPAGRGAAVAYGLGHCGGSDVVGFVDADHAMDQAVIDELARVFGHAKAPVAVQGVCASVNESASLLARLLSVEREWLEMLELDVSARLGGMCQFGGGQGFFQRTLLDDPGLQIDEDMILDDTDLSCRLAMRGHDVVFDPHVVTKSRQVETVGEFIDQRSRWTRGWLQVGWRHLLSAFSARGVRPGVRADLFRFAAMPLASACLSLGFAAAAATLLTAGAPALKRFPVLAVLLWPVGLGPQPYVAGVRSARVRDLPFVLTGLPLLLASYVVLLAVAVAEAAVLRRPVRFAKAPKPD